MSDIGFAMNYTNLYEIDTTPYGDSRTWVRVGAGINSVSWEGNEEVAQDPYYDGDGLSSSDVTGGQIVGSFEGHRVYGDAAQDYIAGLTLKYGEDRKTNFRWTQPNGDQLEGIVTIANIAPQSGDPNAKSDFGFEIHYNGMPKFTSGNASEMPNSISASKPTLSVSAGSSDVITVTVEPESASGSVVFAVEDESIATVGSDGTVVGVANGETEVSIKSCVRPSVVTSVKVTVSGAAQTSASTSSTSGGK